MTLIRRLTHHYVEIQKNPPPLCYAEPKDPSKDMIHWIGWIEGAEETPYTGGKFHLSIDFPSDFPFKPPRIKFLTPIYHPNISTKEVIQQLTSNFKPDISLIKKYIEILIEKEYFRRDSKDKDILHYLA
ncbi:unnamed protein product [Adineta steineri]|uniref:UBC core domain-containing protein n=1 Tax=Adineta steineri TaxID=433720 RepID=A0A814LRU7_9BILA|nr:unnamed protein product [Adineta steineri]